MGIKVGEVDIIPQLLENEFRILVLEQVVDLLLRRFPVVGGSPISQEEMSQLRQRAIEILQKKYPQSGISIKPGDK
jgi:hypothetical protein